MKALTLWRPWPFAIFHLPPPVAKRVENRFDELRAALDELVRRGVLARGDGGYAVASLEALGVQAAAT